MSKRKGPETLQEQADALVRLQGGSELERQLIETPVGRVEDHSEGANATFWVKLEDGTECFHKPIYGTDATVCFSYGQDPDEPSIHEVAAWRLASGLGAPASDLVAPCVLRTVGDAVGALSLRFDGADADRDDFEDIAAQVYFAGFFDALVGQQDRHLGNVRHAIEAGRLGLFDHGFAFARPGDLLNASELLGWRRLEGVLGLRDDEIAALDTLLGSTDLLGVATVLSAERIDALEIRARRMQASGRVLKEGEF